MVLKAGVSKGQDGLFSVKQVVPERVVTGYFDVVGFDFHGCDETGPSRNVTDFVYAGRG